MLFGEGVKGDPGVLFACNPKGRDPSASTLRPHPLYGETDLALVGLAREESTDRLRILGVKNYLEGYQLKNSGWEVIKRVVGWGEHAFEIQIQSMNNYLPERNIETCCNGCSALTPLRPPLTKEFGLSFAPDSKRNTLSP